MISGVLLPLRPAAAAEATLMIKVRLVRCITQNERKFMCDSENLCCEFIEGFDHEADVAERHANRLQPSDASIWISDAPPRQEAVIVAR